MDRLIQTDAQCVLICVCCIVVRGRDPSAVAVLLEDSAAVLGVFLAGSCLSLTHMLNNPLYDAVGSICIGSQSLYRPSCAMMYYSYLKIDLIALLGSVALFLVKRNSELLVGRLNQFKYICMVSQANEVFI